MIELKGDSLTFDEFSRIVYRRDPVFLHPLAVKKVQESRRWVEGHLLKGNKVYGVNTGFGKLSETSISAMELDALQLNLIRSHACGIGEIFSEEVSRAMLLLRANALAKGYSGVCVETLQRLIDCLNKGVHPLVPSQGSLGASGDLAPLSHLALVLVGEGKAQYKGEILSGKQALEKAGLKPITLKAKEGLALINGTQAMTGLGVIAYLEAEYLADIADRVASLTIEGLRGVIDAFYPEPHSVRPFPEQQKVAARIYSFLSDSQLVTKQGEERVQDAYSIRCIPQVHGAVRQVLGYVRDTLLIEMNAATDNPLIFTESDQVISSGNFHGQPIAFAMDFLGIAVSELANISERRTERLVNPQLSEGLPAFLSNKPGLESGLMIAQYAAASLVSENKSLAHPASVDSIPSSANQEDHVSMGTTAASHAASIIRNSRVVLAIEAICAAQAVDFRGVNQLGTHSKQFHQHIREVVPILTTDRVLSTDIENMAEAIKQRRFILKEGFDE
ncbi:histidine ammonia-lyase [Alkalicoccobacillus murimartini]|uniref:Histidine ammonia-lyase n=1 Tax=Alkalicoccobacillus murimartini TaxID=171685 RepID=A0ABT9YIY0_9BACI|nr:histidine ammonia-lyase [Alkalicoccobacillus murimartini]MDQ0207671.1 histidine ammonia-lyase [Alkalicoccobacillus murimartini]